MHLLVCLLFARYVSRKHQYLGSLLGCSDMLSQYLLPVDFIRQTSWRRVALVPFTEVLPDGQAIAVKQHKLASTQGDHEFCSEVEVLSCAQHPNVVMLIGFCVEDKRRLLVYEYICNGSLDSHLYGNLFIQVDCRTMYFLSMLVRYNMLCVILIFIKLFNTQYTQT